MRNSQGHFLFSPGENKEILDTVGGGAIEKRHHTDVNINFFSH